jgi:acyl-CoA thioesterase
LKTVNEIVDNMMATDQMSQWLGIKIKKYTEGNIILEMTVREEMVNGFGIAHGGITYSFADSAFAFAVNSFGIQAVSIETSISHLKAVNVGDVLTTSTTQISLSNSIGVFLVDIWNQDNIKVATFKGTALRKRQK